jgi:rhamnosyl/mannosyltransferase
MRVLQFGKFYPPYIGGIEKVMYDVTVGLNSRGIHCDVLCSNTARQYVEEDAGDYRIIRTASYGVFLSVSITPQILRKFREIQEHYDIIHMHLPNPVASMALLLARPRSKVVLHWHNDIIRQKFMLKFYRPLQAWMLRRADAIIATSPNYIEGSPYLADHRDKCYVVPIGVDKARLRASPGIVAGIRKRFAGKHIVFSIGRLTPYKGYRYLIDAAKYLDDDFVILIAGSGPLRTELSRQIAAQGLGGKVHLLGPVDYDDVGSYYEASDVYCLSSISRNEGFGIVQLEAMLFRKPVVSTAIEGSGVTWANLDGETGLVVPSEDARALAGAIVRICSDRGLAGRLGDNGFRRATEYFTMDRMLTSTLEVYRAVQGQKAGGGAERP